LRIPLANPHQNKNICDFRHGSWSITNFEMESSALAGLARLMGHRATTCCMVIANRLTQKADTTYKGSINSLIQLVLQRI
jgi:uridine phosphorylase